MSPNNEPKIAVIAVHGVGDHEPYVSARDIGDMLANLARAEDPGAEYTPFTEVLKRISVRPVKRSRPFDVPEKSTWGPMDAIARAVRKDQLPLSSADNERDSLDHRFMEGQLSKYTARLEPPYSLLRLEGKRMPRPDEGADAPERVVHVYEMYWADLSRLGNAFTRIFAELYQLLFHLGSVAVNVLKAAAASNHEKTEEGAWNRFARAQWCATAMLAWPIPILNLFMAAFVPAILGVSLLRSHPSVKIEFAGLDLLVDIVITVAVFAWLRAKNNLGKPWYALAIPFTSAVAIAAGVAGSSRIGEHQREGVEYCYALILSLAGFGVVGWVVSLYQKRRPGSNLAAGIIGIVFFIALVVIEAKGFSTFRSPTDPPVAVLLNATEIAGAMLGLSWIGFFFAYYWAYIEGWRVVRASADKPKARSARWTARLVSSLCVSLFIVVTIAVWAGVVEGGSRMLPVAMKYRPIAAEVAEVAGAVLDRHHISGEPRQKLQTIADQKNGLASTWARQELIPGIILLFPIATAMLIALLGAIWALAPSLIGEIRPPKRNDDRKRAERELKWLTDGFWLLRVPAFLFFLVIWLPLIAVPLWIFFPEGKRLNLLEISTITMTTIAGGAAIGLAGFAGRIKKVALGLRPALRAMLDVDSWLREHPLESNPTARICARYVSLLRHISAWRDGVQGYDAIVIVAHSQGTVITADLLRFLNAERGTDKMAAYDADLAILDKKVYLFTMGCPLRQLYGLRFPYLYSYAFDGRDQPDPAKLGVAQWDNGYRSADYVGRHLWPDAIGAPWGTGVRCEELIGPGAHTHYWDHTAEAIARRLDEIIRLA